MVEVSDEDFSSKIADGDLPERIAKKIPRLYTAFSALKVTDKTACLKFCEKVTIDNDLAARFSTAEFETLTPDILKTVLTTPTSISEAVWEFLGNLLSPNGVKTGESSNSSAEVNPEEQTLKKLLNSKEKDLEVALQELRKLQIEHEAVKENNVSLTQTNKQLEERCKNLDHELKTSLQALIEARESSNTQPKEGVINASLEYERVVSENVRLLQQVREYMKKVEGLQHELEETKDQLSKIAFESKIEGKTKERQLSNAMVELERTREQFDGKVKECERLETEIVNLTARTLSQTQQLESLHLQFQSSKNLLAKELDELKVKLKAEEQANLDLKDEISRLKERLEEKAKHLELIAAQNVKNTENDKVQLTQRDSLLKNFEEEKLSLNNTISDLRLQCQKQEMMLNDLREEVAKAKSQAQSKQKDNDELLKGISELTVQNSFQAAEIENLRKINEDIKDTLQNEIAVLMTNNTTKDNRIEQLTKELSLLKTQLAEKSGEGEMLALQLSKYNTLKKELEEAKYSLQQDTEELTARLRNQEQENTVLQKEILNIKGQLSKKTQEYDELFSKNRDSSQQANYLQAVIKQCEEAKTKLQESNEQLSSSLAAQKTLNETLETQATKYREEIEEKTHQLENLARDYEQISGSLNQKINELRAKNETQQKLMINLQSENTGMKQALESRRLEVETLSNENAVLATKNNSLKAQITELESQVKTHNETVVTLQRNMAKAKENAKYWNDRANELISKLDGKENELNTKFKELQDNILKAEERAQNAEREVSSQKIEIGRLNDNLTTLKQQLVLMQQKNESLERKLRDSEQDSAEKQKRSVSKKLTENGIMTAKMNELQQRFNLLQSELDEKKEKIIFYEDSLSKLEKKSAEATQTMTENQKIIQALRKEIEAIKNENSQLVNVLTRLKETLSAAAQEPRTSEAMQSEVHVAKMLEEVLNKLLHPLQVRNQSVGSKETLNVTEGTSETERANLHASVRVLQEENENLKKKIERYERVLGDKTADRSNVSKERKELNDQISALLGNQSNRNSLSNENPRASTKSKYAKTPLEKIAEIETPNSESRKHSISFSQAEKSTNDTDKKLSESFHILTEAEGSIEEKAPANIQLSKSFSFGVTYPRSSIGAVERDTPKYIQDFESARKIQEAYFQGSQDQNTAIADRDEKIKMLSSIILELQKKLKALQIEKESIEYVKSLPEHSIQSQLVATLTFIRLLKLKERDTMLANRTSHDARNQTLKQRIVEFIQRNGSQKNCEVAASKRREYTINKFKVEDAQSKLHKLEATQQYLLRKLESNRGTSNDPDREVSSSTATEVKNRVSARFIVKEHPFNSLEGQILKSPRNAQGESQRQVLMTSRDQNISHIALSRDKAKALFKLSWLALFAAERVRINPHLEECQKLLNSILQTVENQCDSSWNLKERVSFVISTLNNFSPNSKEKKVREGSFRNEYQLPELTERFSIDTIQRNKPLSTDTSRLLSAPSVSSSDKTPLAHPRTLDELQKQIKSESFSFSHLEEHLAKLGSLMTKKIDQNKLVARVLELWRICKRINDIQQESINELVSSIRGSSEVLKKLAEAFTSKSGYSLQAKDISDNTSDSLVLVRNNLKCLEQVLAQLFGTYFNLFKQANGLSNELFSDSLTVQDTSLSPHTTHHKQKSSKYAPSKLETVAEQGRMPSYNNLERFADHPFVQKSGHQLSIRGQDSQNLIKRSDKSQDFSRDDGSSKENQSYLEAHSQDIILNQRSQEQDTSRDRSSPRQRNYRAESLFTDSSLSKAKRANDFGNAFAEKIDTQSSHDRSLSEPASGFALFGSQNLHAQRQATKEERGKNFSISEMNQSVIIHGAKDSFGGSDFLESPEIARNAFTERRHMDKMTTWQINSPTITGELSNNSNEIYGKDEGFLLRKTQSTQPGKDGLFIPTQYAYPDEEDEEGEASRGRKHKTIHIAYHHTLHDTETKSPTTRPYFFAEDVTPKSPSST